jgi:hypothetical protein
MGRIFDLYNWAGNETRTLKYSRPFEDLYKRSFTASYHQYLHVIRSGVHIEIKYGESP